jgi:inner membrane protein
MPSSIRDMASRASRRAADRIELLWAAVASIGHIAFGLACGRAYSPDPVISRKAALAFTLVSVWPDLDEIGFLFGVPYEAPFGHRGATHSLIVALLVGLASYPFARRWKLPATRTVVYTTIVAASHGLLDTMTYGGGLGCALLWPLSNQRFWSAVRFIPVAPIGLHMFTWRGFRVALAELFIFAPLWIYYFWPRRKTVA